MCINCFTQKQFRPREVLINENIGYYIIRRFSRGHEKRKEK